VNSNVNKPSIEATSSNSPGINDIILLLNKNNDGLNAKLEKLENNILN
jgi:hypothetical protein